LAVALLVFRQSLPPWLGDGLFAVTVVLFVSVKLAFQLHGVDALAVPEQHACYVLFGGLVDDLEMYWAERQQQQQHDDHRPGTSTH